MRADEDWLDPDIVADFVFLSKRKGSNVYAELLGRFIAGWPGRMQALATATQAAEQAEISRLLHSIKGVAASLGLRLLCQRAAALETAPADVDAAAVEHLQALAKESFARAHAVEIPL